MMRGENWVRVPIFARGIVPIGIGSAKITAEGEIEITIPNGKFFGTHAYELALRGMLDGLMLENRLIPTEEAKQDDHTTSSTDV